MADNIERCVKNSRHKWIDKYSGDQERPPILLVWPVKLGTNLSPLEILKLEYADFQLPHKDYITSTRLFSTSAHSLDVSRVDAPANLDTYPSSKQSKSTIRYATASSTNKCRRWPLNKLCMELF